MHSLSVRFDQKGHERPFQKAVIVDVVDGYLNAGDRIVIRITSGAPAPWAPYGDLNVHAYDSVGIAV